MCRRDLKKTPLRITDEPSDFSFIFGEGDGKTDRPKTKISRGDLVSYNGHISIVYSETWGESRFRSDYPESEYDIIHAFGNRNYHNDFSRKVLITGNDIRNQRGEIIIPIGFGRIKLWN